MSGSFRRCFFSHYLTNPSLGKINRAVENKKMNDCDRGAWENSCGYDMGKVVVCCRDWYLRRLAKCSGDCGDYGSAVCGYPRKSDFSANGLRFGLNDWVVIMRLGLTCLLLLLFFFKNHLRVF